MLLCNLDIFNLNKGTNRQKRELFVVAVRSASGDTLPVNLTIIPSAQKWVFNAIYQLAFPSLYSSNVCSMNRLVLTDEDEAEYAPFQSAIASNAKNSYNNNEFPQLLGRITTDDYNLAIHVLEKNNIYCA